MIYEYDLLPEPLVKNVLDFYDFSDFVSGNMSGPKNKSVKNNLEMKNDEHFFSIRKMVAEHLWSKFELTEILCMRKLSNLIFSKYDEGMFYEFHNDHYLINSCRTDYSCTLFLNDPEEYDGGELEMVFGNQSLKYKLKPGRAVIYPTGLTHKVHQVTRGTRKVICFWMESAIADPSVRSLVVDLTTSWYKYKDKLLDEMPEMYDILLKTKFHLHRQFGNYDGL
jgi:PKHD-type hydroxylase